tara:strand:+ start:4520 stop:4846 length:327 start_codon:yes stop_codon:yes gene_type:complete
MKVSDTSIYLEAAAITKDTPVTIAGARKPRSDEKGLDGRPFNPTCVILSYEKGTKEHVACRTTQKQIRALHGNDMDDWKGKKITLFPDTCKAFGNAFTPCIRVRGRQL